MSFCCENPIDLGCHSACAPILTNIVQPVQSYYTIAYQFNGALITREWLADPVNGFLQVPSYIFNEASNVTFQIYDGDNVLVSCFKATILPSNSTFVPQPPAPPYDAFTTTMQYLGIIGACNNGEHIHQFRINYNDIQGMLVNTYFELGAVMLHGGNPHPFTLYYDAALTQPIFNNEQYLAGSRLPNLDVFMSTTLSNCNQHFTFSIQVNQVGFIAPGYVNTNNFGTTFNYTN